MSETLCHRRLAALMCVIFASHLVVMIFGMCAGVIMKEIGPNVYHVINCCLDLPIIVGTFLIVCNRVFYVSNGARLSGWVLLGVMSLNFLNVVCYIISDYNFYNWLGKWIHIIFPAILAGVTVWFYAGLRLWIPVKIAGIISALPQIISGVLLFLITGEDYSEYFMSVVKAIGVSVGFSVALYLGALIVSVVWLFRCHRGSHKVIAGG